MIESMCWVGLGCVLVDAARSIVVFKNDEDKILALDKFKLLAASGYVVCRRSIDVARCNPPI